MPMQRRLLALPALPRPRPRLGIGVAAAAAAATAQRAFSTKPGGALESVAAMLTPEGGGLGAVTVTLGSGSSSHSATVVLGGDGIKPLQEAGVGPLDAAAVATAGEVIAGALEGLPLVQQSHIDLELQDLSSQLTELLGGGEGEAGAVAARGLVAATSMAAATGGAAASEVPLYHHIAALGGKPTDQFVIPIPFATILSGGKRATNQLPVQDVLACATGALCVTSGPPLPPAGQSRRVPALTCHDAMPPPPPPPPLLRPTGPTRTRWSCRQTCSA
jgi:hypothetical protein